MGSFSWTRAEATTQRSNLSYGDGYKILVPKIFGGGAIFDTYEDYGEVFTKFSSVYVDSSGNRYEAKMFEKADLYGILAYWNNADGMIYDGKKYPTSMISILVRGKTSNPKNRNKGIKIGCYDDDIDHLKYPLKLVSLSYNGTYEECPGVSYDDPNQGFQVETWTSEYKKYQKRWEIRNKNIQKHNLFAYL